MSPQLTRRGFRRCRHTKSIGERIELKLLNLSSRWEKDRFLKNAHAYIDYTDADLEQDIDAIRKLGS